MIMHIYISIITSEASNITVGPVIRCYVLRILQLFLGPLGVNVVLLCQFQ